jgi:hypothetical protein
MIWIFTIGALVILTWSASHFVVSPVVEFMVHHPLRDRMLLWYGRRPWLPRTIGHMVFPLIMAPTFVWIAWRVRSVVHEYNPGARINVSQTLALVRLGIIEMAVATIAKRINVNEDLDSLRLSALTMLLADAHQHFCPWLIVQR